MKKWLLRFCLIAGLALTASLAQAQNISSVSSALSDFSASVAPALPSLGSSSLNWSEAYIGDLIGIPPHFGVGVSVQAVFIPMKGIDSVFNALGVTKPAILNSLSIGVPIPAYAAEVRIGGIIIPIDIGLKFGILPNNVKSMTGDVAIDYLMYGGELRWAILKDTAVSPGLSLGADYTYLKGGVYYTMGDITLTSVPTPTGPQTVALSKPKIGFEWETKVIELKAQISKNLLIITPYAGLGASLSWSSAGGGFYATPTIGGTAMTSSQMDYLKSNFPGNPALANVSADGIGIKYLQNNIFAFRVFGGLSLNLAIVRLDFSAMYNFSSGSLGGDFGLRIQI